jgi:hypothetical protein
MLSIFNYFKNKKSMKKEEVLNVKNSVELTSFLKMNKAAREKKAIKMGFANAATYISLLKGNTTTKVVEEAPEIPATRTVKLVYEYCCGCGCWDLKIKRIVPFDSKLKDGDRIKQADVKSSDKEI